MVGRSQVKIIWHLIGPNRFGGQSYQELRMAKRSSTGVDVLWSFLIFLSKHRFLKSHGFLGIICLSVQYLGAIMYGRRYSDAKMFFKTEYIHLSPKNNYGFSNWRSIMQNQNRN